MQPMLFATMATLSVSIVLMHLGSFMYSTFGSHRGQSFKLLYKKIKILHKQGLHPAEILKVLKHKGLLVSFLVLCTSLEHCVSLVPWQIYLDQEDLRPKSCLWKQTVQNKYK